MGGQGLEAGIAVGRSGVLFMASSDHLEAPMLEDVCQYIQ